MVKKERKVYLEVEVVANSDSQAREIVDGETGWLQDRRINSAGTVDNPQKLQEWVCQNCGTPFYSVPGNKLDPRVGCPYCGMPIAKLGILKFVQVNPK